MIFHLKFFVLVPKSAFILSSPNVYTCLLLFKKFLVEKFHKLLLTKLTKTVEMCNIAIVERSALLKSAIKKIRRLAAIVIWC